MKKTDTEILYDQILAQIHSTAQLKEVSLSLESIDLDRHFKTHASNIVNDSELNPSQKKRQLVYLCDNIDDHLIHDFFCDLINDGEFWLFDNQKIDYLDEFVKKFQQATETIHILHLIHDFSCTFL